MSSSSKFLLALSAASSPYVLNFYILWGKNKINANGPFETLEYLWEKKLSKIQLNNKLQDISSNLEYISHKILPHTNIYIKFKLLSISVKNLLNI